MTHNISPENKTPHERKPVPIILLWFFVGPPVGGLLTVLGTVLFLSFEFDIREALNVLGGISLYEMVWIPIYLLFGSLMGYVFGGVQALLTALLLKRWYKINGTVGYGAAAGAAAVVGLLAAILLTAFSGEAAITDFKLSVVLFLAGIAASVVVRFLFRRSLS